MMNLNFQTVLILSQIFKFILNILLKSSKTLTSISPIHVYINRINNGLVFKIQDGYKVELQTSETMQLFASTKNVIEKTKNGENVPSLDVVYVILVPCNFSR